MWRDAKRILSISGANADELAEGFDTLRKQISSRDPSWIANRQVSSDGSYIWTGETRPFIFVISPDGRMFEAPNAGQVVEYVNGGLRPIYEKMTEITR